jgi:hypothetical protein
MIQPGDDNQEYVIIQLVDNMNVTINVVIYVIITTGPEFFMQSCQ